MASRRGELGLGVREKQDFKTWRVSCPQLREASRQPGDCEDLGDCEAVGWVREHRCLEPTEGDMWEVLPSRSGAGPEPLKMGLQTSPGCEGQPNQEKPRQVSAEGESPGRSRGLGVCRQHVVCHRWERPRAKHHL